VENIVVVFGFVGVILGLQVLLAGDGVIRKAVGNEGDIAFSGTIDLVTLSGYCGTVREEIGIVGYRFWGCMVGTSRSMMHIEHVQSFVHCPKWKAAKTAVDIHRIWITES